MYMRRIQTCKSSRKRQNKSSSRKRRIRKSVTKKRRTRKTLIKRQYGGNFNIRENEQLRNALVEMNYTEDEMADIITKLNVLSQSAAKNFNFLIDAVYNIQKENFIHWLNDSYNTQIEQLDTDTEDNDIEENDYPEVD